MSQLPKEIVDKIGSHPALRKGAEIATIHYSQIIEEKDKEIANIKTVMIAAAEEIQENWQAHCDEEGYGPANLMLRLEKGIPSEYGYKAGRFKEMQSEIEGLKAENEALRDDKQNIETLNEIMVNQADEISKLQSQIKGLLEALQKIQSGTIGLSLADRLNNCKIIADKALANYYNSTKQPLDNGKI